MACVKSRRRFRRGLVRGLWGTGKKDNKQRLPGTCAPGRPSKSKAFSPSLVPQPEPAATCIFYHAASGSRPFFCLVPYGSKAGGKGGPRRRLYQRLQICARHARAGAFSSRLSRPLRGITPSVQSAQHLHFCHAQLPMRLTRTQALSRSLSSSGQCRAA